MTLELQSDPDILKMFLHNENEAASLRHSKIIELKLGQNTEMPQGQRSKCKMLKMTLSIIVTDIPTKTHQFPTGSF